MGYTDRKEQREVNELMNSILSPLMPRFNEKTQELLIVALRILRTTEINEEGGDDHHE